MVQGSCPLLPAPVTTSDAESLLRKPAAALGRPKSEREQFSIKMVTMKFSGAQQVEYRWNNCAKKIRFNTHYRLC